MSFANSRAAMTAYHNVSVESIVDSASPTQLVLMLYEGAIAAIASAQQHMRLKDIAAKGKSISQAISIIDSGLRASLDLNVGGALAQNLSELYQYMGRRLLHGNINNDPAALDEVRVLLQQLRGAWEDLAASTSASAAKQSAAPQLHRVANSYGSI